MRQALADLGLKKGVVAFDDPMPAASCAMDGIETRDGYNPMMYARSVKTDEELALLQRAADLNQTAIERCVAGFEAGMSWRELNRSYERHVTALGGYVHDPGGMVLASPRGADSSVSLDTGLDDFTVEPGTHVMFDCHGSINLYGWDGGKCWIVGGEAKGAVQTAATATAMAMHTIEAAMRPGVDIATLQALGRDVYRRHGVPDCERILIFFHGLGLSHMDLEVTTADGQANHNWRMEKNMVVAVHLLVPGAERERMWLEDVAVVGEDGAKPLFSWDFAPFQSAG